jgi:hypothetical protein
MARLLGGILISVFFAATTLAEPPRPLEYRTISLGGDKGRLVTTADNRTAFSQEGDLFHEDHRSIHRRSCRGDTSQCRNKHRGIR